MQGGAGQELPFLPSSEAAPPRNIKYEFGMKNEDYHNRCPSYHLLTKRIGLQPDTLSLRAARIVVLFILAGAESLPLHVHIKTAF